MPAYMNDLKKRCYVCAGPARVEVFNRFNASCGYFCTQHGKMKVNELDKSEKYLEQHDNNQGPRR